MANCSPHESTIFHRNIIVVTTTIAKKNNQTFALIQLQNINLLFQKNEEERKLY